MCSSYWELEAEFTCPKCGSKQSDVLQTHFMGSPGSCLNKYELLEPVEELGDFIGFLGPHPQGWKQDETDDFIGSCEDCGEFLDLAAFIFLGRVLAVWPYEKT